MKDVNYYINEAGYRSQQGFEYVFADIVDVFDIDQTTLTTEDGKTMIINWNMAGKYKSHSIVDNRVSVVDKVVEMLKEADVDGEMMMEILKQVGMKDQMLHQLIATMPLKDVEYRYIERKYLEKVGAY